MLNIYILWHDFYIELLSTGDLFQYIPIWSLVRYGLYLIVTWIAKSWLAITIIMVSIIILGWLQKGYKLMPHPNLWNDEKYRYYHLRNWTRTFHSEDATHASTCIRCRPSLTVIQNNVTYLEGKLVNLKVCSLSVGTLNCTSGKTKKIIAHRLVNICCVKQTRFEGKIWLVGKQRIICFSG